jgi:hypothetical protein
MNSFITTFVIAATLSIAALSQNTRSLDEIMQVGDNYYKEFNHERARETYLLADSFYPSNWVIMWKISRAYVDIGEKLPQETGEEEEAKKAIYDKALFYADSSVKLADNEAEAYIKESEYEKAKENLLLIEKAPFVDEDDDKVLDESKELITKVDAELS